MIILYYEVLIKRVLFDLLDILQDTKLSIFNYPGQTRAHLEIMDT